MDPIIKITILLYLVISFITRKLWEPYILAIPAFLYLTPFGNVMPDIFGLSFPLVVELGIIFIVSLKIFIERSLPFNIFISQKAATYLLIFFFVILLNHYFMGSQVRLTFRSYSIPPILHLMTILAVISISYKYMYDAWHLIKICRIMLWLNLLYGLYVIYFGGHYTGHDTIGIEGSDIEFDPNDYAIYSIQLLIIELSIALKTSKTNYILLLLPILGCLLTFSRGGIIALALIMIYWFSNIQVKYKFLFPLSVLTILIINFVDLSFIITRFNEVSLRGGIENFYRYKMFFRGLYMFFDNIILGTGVGTYYQYRYTYSEFAIGAYDDSHNLYIQILSETGLVGAILFIVFLISLWNNINKINNDNALSLMGSSIFILFIIYGFFIHHKYMFNFYLPLLVLSYYGESLFKKSKLYNAS